MGGSRSRSRDAPHLGPGATTAAELAHHWARAGRPVEALMASLDAAADAEAVYGLAEASRIWSARWRSGTPYRVRTSSRAPN